MIGASLCLSLAPASIYLLVEDVMASLTSVEIFKLDRGNDTSMQSHGQQRCWLSDQGKTLEEDRSWLKAEDNSKNELSVEDIVRDPTGVVEGD